MKLYESIVNMVAAVAQSVGPKPGCAVVVVTVENNQNPGVAVVGDADAALAACLSTAEMIAQKLSVDLRKMVCDVLDEVEREATEKKVTLN